MIPRKLFIIDGGKNVKMGLIVERSFRKLV